MIREIPFQCNLENPVAVLEFKSELSKIVKHYDPLTISEGSQNLNGKINIPTVSSIGFPFSTRWPLAVLYQYRSPQWMIFDSCLWYISRMIDDSEPAQYSTDTV